MELVVDANILIAAFLKAALTRALLIDERLVLFAPAHLISETRKVIRQNPRLTSFCCLARIGSEKGLDTSKPLW